MQENSELLSAESTVKDVKIKIIDAKGRAVAVRELMEVYGHRTRQPQSFSPSCIISDIIDPRDSEEFVHRCALCDKGFPNRDVVMASYGCYYHPWCIVTQTWHSK